MLILLATDLAIESLSYMLLHDQAYLFNDYWEDIGTVKSFFDANLALTEQVGDTSTQSILLYYYFNL